MCCCFAGDRHASIMCEIKRWARKKKRVNERREGMSGKIFGEACGDDVPLAAADSTTAVVLLLLLHLLEDGLLLDFDEIPAVVLAEPEPELFDALALLRCAGGPYLVIFLLLLPSSWWSRLVWRGGVGGWRRWMVMSMIMTVRLRVDGSL